MDDLLTTKQVQEFLQIDRTTIYRMLKDGRLTGVKVGQQWRFLRQEIEALLATVPSPSENEDEIPATPTDVLPLHCIQAVQDVFAEMAGVGSVTTSLDGQPLTSISNSNRFCNLILDSPSGRQACISCWRHLATQKESQPRFLTCHAGLLYARARIEVNHTYIAMLIAGQFYDRQPDPDEQAIRIAQLARVHDLDAGQLAACAGALPVLDERMRAPISGWLKKVAHTFSDIGRERADLMNRLRKIASISMLETIL
jgi:excisionase family DNA binding protein